MSSSKSRAILYATLRADSENPFTNSSSVRLARTAVVITVSTTDPAPKTSGPIGSLTLMYLCQMSSLSSVAYSLAVVAIFIFTAAVEEPASSP